MAVGERKPLGDIEIVAIPRYREEEGQRPDLFHPPPVHEVSLVWEAIEAMGPDLDRCKVRYIAPPLRIDASSLEPLP